MVRERGLEPLRESHWILSPARLPVPPLSHDKAYFHGFRELCQWNIGDVVYKLYKAMDEIFCCVQILLGEKSSRGGGRARINHGFTNRERKQALIHVCNQIGITKR